MDRSEPREERYLGLTASQFNLAFFAVVGAIGLGIAIYFGAFGALQDFFGDEGSSSGSAVAEKATPTPAPSATSALTPQEAADSAVLTLDDMRSGWMAAPPDDDEDDLEVSEECAILNELAHPTGEIAYAESDELEGPEGQKVTSDASVFSDQTTAQEALDTFDSALSRCRDEFLVVFEEAMLEEWELQGYDTSQITLDISLQDLAFPEHGDSMSAYRLEMRMTVEDTPVVFTIDFVVMRAGRMVAGFNYLALGAVNSLEEELLAARAAEKLAEANSFLAE